jgi:hypothetical protein
VRYGSRAIRLLDEKHLHNELFSRAGFAPDAQKPAVVCAWNGNKSSLFAGCL